MKAASMREWYSLHEHGLGLTDTTNATHTYAYRTDYAYRTEPNRPDAEPYRFLRQICGPELYARKRKRIPSHNVHRGAVAGEVRHSRRMWKAAAPRLGLDVRRGFCRTTRNRLGLPPWEAMSV